MQLLVIVGIHSARTARQKGHLMVVLRRILHMGEALRHCRSFFHSGFSPLHDFIFSCFLLSFFPVLWNRLAATNQVELLCCRYVTNYFSLSLLAS